jgi:hypothetical protein
VMLADGNTASILRNVYEPHGPAHQSTTWLASALIVGPRLPCQIGVGLTCLKLLSVYSKYCAFLYFVFIRVALLFLGVSVIVGMPPISECPPLPAIPALTVKLSPLGA